jgi:hypothetical protein
LLLHQFDQSFIHKTSFFTNYLQEKLEFSKRKAFSKNLKIIRFADDEIIINIINYSLKLEYQVNLRKMECTCGQLQIREWLCSHLIKVACAHVPIQQMIHPFYALDNFKENIPKIQLLPDVDLSNLQIREVQPPNRIDMRSSKKRKRTHGFI